jgi:hypothetical protein
VYRCFFTETYIPDGEHLFNFQVDLTYGRRALIFFQEPPNGDGCPAEIRTFSAMPFYILRQIYNNFFDQLHFFYRLGLINAR